MIWLFERGNRVTRLVTRFDPASSDYVLDVDWSDGASSTERFVDAESFKLRLLALEQQLLAEDWKHADGSPKLIGDWWKP
jgi:hypothetical protein